MEKIKNLVLWSVIFAAFIFLIRDYLSVLPVWDSYWSYQALLQPVADNVPISEIFQKWIVNWHLNIGYTWLPAIVQKIFPYQTSLIYLFQALLLFLSAIALYGALNVIFKKQKTLNVLFASLYLLNPLVLSTTLNFNRDFPILIFFSNFLFYFLKQKRWTWLLFATLLCLSKMTGLIVYASFILSFILFTKINNGTKKVWDGSYFMLLIPVFIVIGFLIMVSFFETQADFESHIGGGLLFMIEQWLDNFRLKHFFAVLGQTFILNFHWVFTLAMIFGSLLFLLNKKFSFSSVRRLDFHKTVTASLFTTFFIYVIFHASYRLYANPRYISLIGFLLPILVMVYIRKLNVRKEVTLIGASIMLILFCIQSKSTIDPISKLYFNTFKVGTVTMIDPGSPKLISDKVHGRDELAYNLQHLSLNKAWCKLQQALEDSIVCVVPIHGIFYNVYPLDSKGQLALVGQTRPIDYRVFIKMLEFNEFPDNIVFIDMPWLSAYKAELNAMSEYYQLNESKQSCYKKYCINYYELSKRN